MWGYKNELLTPNRKIIFIGNGPAWAIKGFKEDLKIDFPVYTDPTLEIYKATQMKRGLWETLGLKSLLSAAKLFSQGHRQIGVQGDKFQQGGIIVVSSKGEILFHHVSRFLGDFPEIQKIKDALAE